MDDNVFFGRDNDDVIIESTSIDENTIMTFTAIADNENFDESFNNFFSTYSSGDYPFDINSNR